MHSFYSHREDHSPQKGFSLIELSIVLVILGLLTGGILTGQSLIRSSELRAVTTESTEFATAINTFKGKYFAIPGDMNNATAFWGAAHATPATCITTAGTGKQTCNGNGTGNLDVLNGASQYSEMFTFWQHLANAGLIEGSFTGRGGSGNPQHHILGTNAPTSKLPGAGWLATWAGTFPGNAMSYALQYDNFLEIGGATTNDFSFNPILTPEEAWNIDTKVDDGKPAQGKVVSRYWNNLCSAADDGSSANNDLVASYRVQDTAARCTLMFRQFF
ncbi:MAG: prepilin-type N-terminal cleavage/methylation domain-containing protein [Candidatus Kapaibacterium sp.]|nr:MAG: prepilin-type N-terminal cleavage/methylation domain-containing protein [Candidatus Kapabacteria bacterium]